MLTGTVVPTKRVTGISRTPSGQRHTPTNGTVKPRRTIPHTISSHSQCTTYGIEIGVGSSELNASGQLSTLGLSLGKSLVDGTSIFRKAKHHIVVLLSLSFQGKRTEENGMLFISIQTDNLMSSMFGEESINRVLSILILDGLHTEVVSCKGIFIILAIFGKQVEAIVAVNAHIAFATETLVGHTAKLPSKSGILGQSVSSNLPHTGIFIHQGKHLHVDAALAQERVGNVIDALTRAIAAFNTLSLLQRKHLLPHPHRESEITTHTWQIKGKLRHITRLHTEARMSTIQGTCKPAVAIHNHKVLPIGLVAHSALILHLFRSTTYAHSSHQEGASQCINQFFHN